MNVRRGIARDAVLYAASALAAAAVALAAGIPQYREWGRLALPSYAAGAVVALLLARRGDSTRLRAALAGAVLLGTALLPLALEAAWRAGSSPGLHAQSEVLVTEEAARALLDGRDPYAATYLRGPLAARPLGTKTHVPYLPAMLLFGLPRALDGRSALADARVAFAAAALGIGWLALSRGPARDGGDDRRLLAAQTLAVLPTGALLMATGGDDLPVLALMLLALVLVERHPVRSGLVAGLAAAMKQTAWPLLPFLLLAAGRRRRRTGFAAGALGVAAPLIGAFLAWNPAAFVEDVLRFPLGLGRQRSAAGTPTLGSLLLRALPQARPAAAAILLLAVAVLTAWLMRRRPRPGAAGAARAAGVVLLAALLLAPSARIGYLVYPANLLVWAFLLAPRGAHGDRSAPRQHTTAT